MIFVPRKGEPSGLWSDPAGGVRAGSPPVLCAAEKKGVAVSLPGRPPISRLLPQSGTGVLSRHRRRGGARSLLLLHCQQGEGDLEVAAVRAGVGGVPVKRHRTVSAGDVVGDIPTLVS